MAQCNYRDVNYIMFQWFTIGLFTKNETIVIYYYEILVMGDKLHNILNEASTPDMKW